MRSGLVVAFLVAVLGTCTASVVVPLVAGPPGSQDAALALVPADAALYATAYLQPSLSQRRAVGGLLERFNVPREQVDGLLNQAVQPLTQVGLEYERDIKPWLGDQVAAFILPTTAGAEPDGAALVASTDIAATRQAVDRAVAAGGVQRETRVHAGVEYQVDPGSGAAVGFVNSFLVAGTERGFTAAVDASRGPGLATRAEYRDTVATLPTDNLLSVWGNPAGLSGLTAVAEDAGAPPAMNLPAAGLAQQRPSALALRMEESALVFETATLLDPNAPAGTQFADAGFLGQLPSGAIAALGIPALGEWGTRALDTFAAAPGGEGTPAIEEGFTTQTGLSLRQDVLRWMGDTGLFVGGTAPGNLNGGLVVRSLDPEATRRAVTTLQTKAVELGMTTVPAQQGTLAGFTVQQGAPAPVTVLGGEQLVVGYGPGAAESAAAPAQRLADSAVYGSAVAALGGGWAPTMFIDVGAAVELGEAFAGQAGVLPPTYAADVKPRVSQVAALTAGTRRDGATTRQRFVVVFAPN